MQIIRLADLNQSPVLTDKNPFKLLHLADAHHACLNMNNVSLVMGTYSCRHFVCSSKYGYFVADTNSGFVMGQTHMLQDKLRNAKDRSSTNVSCMRVPVYEGAVQEICLSADQKHIIVVAGTRRILVYPVAGLATAQPHLLPKVKMSLDKDIIEIQMNPNPKSDLAAVRAADNMVILIDWQQGTVIQKLACVNITAMSWSPNGEHIAWGNMTGGIFCDPLQKFAPVDRIPCPPALGSGVYSVKHILWLEDGIFFVIYDKRPSVAPYNKTIINKAFIIKYGNETGNSKDGQERNDRKGNEKEYIYLDEVTRETTSRPRSCRFYTATLSCFGPDIRRMIIIASNTSSEVSVACQQGDQSWRVLSTDIKLCKQSIRHGATLDTYPVGLGLDLTTTTPVTFKNFGFAISMPLPVLYLATNIGHIYGFHCYSQSLVQFGKPYDGMIKDTESLVSKLPIRDYISNPFSAFADAMKRLSAIPSPGVSAPLVPAGEKSFTATVAAPVSGASTEKKSAEVSTLVRLSLKNTAPKASSSINEGSSSPHSGDDQSSKEIADSKGDSSKKDPSKSSTPETDTKAETTTAHACGDLDMALKELGELNKDIQRVMENISQKKSDIEANAASLELHTPAGIANTANDLMYKVEKATHTLSENLQMLDKLHDEFSQVKRKQNVTQSLLPKRDLKEQSDHIVAKCTQCDSLFNSAEQTLKQNTPSQWKAVNAGPSTLRQIPRSPWMNSLDTAISELEREISQKQDELYYLRGELAEMQDIRNRTREYYSQPYQGLEDDKGHPEKDNPLVAQVVRHVHREHFMKDVFNATL